MSQQLPVIQQKVKDVRAFLEKAEVKKQFEAALPQHLGVERLLRVTMTALRNNPALLDCTRESLFACVLGCATLGLEPEPFLGQAYLVPFKRKYQDRGQWRTKMECQLIPGYRGYIALARRTGEVQSVSVQAVYVNDHFRLSYGLNETLEHTPAEGERGDFRGAYVVVRYKDGSHSFDYMNAADILKIAKRSKTYNQGEDEWSGPWGTDFEEMAKKTVIRRHFKVVPMSVEMGKLTAADDMASMGMSQRALWEEDGGVVCIPEAKDPAQTFEGLVKEKACDQEDLERFISEVAEANGCSEDEVKAQAADQFDSFWGAFEDWVEKKSEENQEETEGEDEAPVGTSGSFNAADVVTMDASKVTQPPRKVTQPPRIVRRNEQPNPNPEDPSRFLTRGITTDQILAVIEAKDPAVLDQAWQMLDDLGKAPDSRPLDAEDLSWLDAEQGEALMQAIAEGGGQAEEETWGVLYEKARVEFPSEFEQACKATGVDPQSLTVTEAQKRMVVKKVNQILDEQDQ